MREANVKRVFVKDETLATPPVPHGHVRPSSNEAIPDLYIALAADAHDDNQL